jgi:anti-anti-sigma regulatory factor
MAVLVKCIEAVTESGGTFAIVAPNEQIMDFLAVVDQERKIRFFADEAALRTGTQSPSPQRS